MAAGVLWLELKAGDQMTHVGRHVFAILKVGRRGGGLEKLEGVCAGVQLQKPV